jgi:hypothetical protein
MYPPYVSSGKPFLEDKTVENDNVSPNDSNATVRFNTNGTTDYSASTGGTFVSGPKWLEVAALAGGNYEIQATVVSGSVGAGSSATGSWLALSSIRLWNAIRTLDFPVGSTTVELDISIRRTGTTTALVTKRYVLTATVS